MSTSARAALCTCAYLLVLQQRPSFRTDVNTIAVYATVRDATGHLVPNLTKDDFTVTDDGQARAAATQPADDGHSGHGIDGMRERAALHGGTLRAGPNPDTQDGWLVEAALRGAG